MVQETQEHLKLRTGPAGAPRFAARCRRTELLLLCARIGFNP
jgi:hypothetical protein